MKLTITIAVIIVMIICNIFYLRWALKEDGSSKGHNFDGKQLIKSQRMARIMLAIALDMGIAGWILFWNGIIGNGLFLFILLIAVLMLNLL